MGRSNETLPNRLHLAILLWVGLVTTGCGRNDWPDWDGTWQPGQPALPGADEGEGVCGGQNDSVNVDLWTRPDSQMPDGVPFGPAAIDAWARATGNLEWGPAPDQRCGEEDLDEVWCKRWCTGTLVGPDLFLTAGHCFVPGMADEAGSNYRWPQSVVDSVLRDGLLAAANVACRDLHVDFDFRCRVHPDGSPMQGSDELCEVHHRMPGGHRGRAFRCAEVLEMGLVWQRGSARAEGLDYALLRLAPDASGHLPAHYARPRPLRTFVPEGQPDAGPFADPIDVGDTLIVFQHPDGAPMRVDVGTVSAESGPGRLSYDDIDTLGGSSGAGVLDEQGRLTGVHVEGGCDWGGANSAVPLSLLLATSARLREVGEPVCHDADLDGAGEGCPAGWDCDDNDPNVIHNCAPAGPREQACNGAQWERLDEWQADDDFDRELLERVAPGMGRFAPGEAGRACSGALVDDDVFLTAGHCAPPAGDCRGGEVVIGGAPRPCIEVIENRYPLLDYALLRLGEVPPGAHAPTPLELDLSDRPDQLRPALVVHYPWLGERGGDDGPQPMRISTGDAFQEDPAPQPSGIAVTGHSAATTRGSSGAPLVGIGGAIFGVHVAEDGCARRLGNRAISIREIVAASPLLREMTGRCPGFRNDECVTRYTQIVSGYEHACALLPDGRARCWGGRQALDPDARYEELSAGTGGTCGVHVGGRAVSCSYADVLDAPAGRRFVGVDSGDWGSQMCGWLDDGRVLCRGNFWWLPDGLPDDLRVSAVALYHSRMCVILADDGGVRCWTHDEPDGVDGPDGVFVSLDASQETACGVRNDGAVVCWGQPSIVDSVPAGRFDEVFVGGHSACARRGESFECWGQEWHMSLLGQVEAEGARDLAIGPFHACWLDLDGRPQCTGTNRRGVATPPRKRHYADVSASLGLICTRDLEDRIECIGLYDNYQRRPLSAPLVEAGRSYACTLDPDGRAACWFQAESGQGDVPGGRFIDLDTGWYAVCAIRADDHGVVCWGDPDWWAGGDEPPLEFAPDGGPAPDGPDAAPLRPPAGAFDRVAAGGQHACGIGEDGRMVCWGTGVAMETDPPEGVFVDLSAGDDHTCALTIYGVVECWGGDDQGQSSVPPELQAMEAVEVTAGRAVSCLRTAAGQARCWGGIEQPTPGVYTRINAGGSFACGTELRGGLRCWGRDLVR